MESVVIGASLIYCRNDFMSYIVAEGIERIFTRPNFFGLESQRKKEGLCCYARGWGVAGTMISQALWRSDAQ